MKIHFYTALLLLMTSCYCTYDIMLKEDGSAHVEISDWQELDGEEIEESAGGEGFYAGYDNFQKSAVISNYKRTEDNGFFKVTYDLKHINDLGFYLVPFVEDTKDSSQTSFQYNGNQLVILHRFEEDGPSEATMFGELIPLKVIFRFEKKIKSFSSELDFVKQVDKRTLEINSDLNTISYGEGVKKVIVTF